MRHPRPRQADHVRGGAHLKGGRDVEQDAADEEKLAHERLAQLHNDGLAGDNDKGGAEKRVEMNAMQGVTGEGRAGCGRADNHGKVQIDTVRHRSAGARGAGRAM